MVWTSLKSKLKYIRELVWPLLEPPDKSTPNLLDENECNWNEDDEDLLIEYIEKYFESEENRKKEVESKSTIFIGTFGVAAAVLINLSKDLIFNDSASYTPLRLLLIFMMTVSIIYLCRAIWFSIKALERRHYSTMGFPKFMRSDRNDKKKQIIIRQFNNIKNNHDPINLKVDYMTMAQEYFKRAVVMVAVFSIVMFSIYIYSYETIKKDLKSLFESISLNQTIFLGLIFVVIVLFVLVTKFYKRSKSLENTIKNQEDPPAFD